MRAACCPLSAKIRMHRERERERDREIDRDRLDVRMVFAKIQLISLCRLAHSVFRLERGAMGDWALCHPAHVSLSHCACESQHICSR